MSDWLYLVLIIFVIAITFPKLALVTIGALWLI